MSNLQQKIQDYVDRYEQKIFRTKGAPEKRARLQRAVQYILDRNQIDRIFSVRLPRIQHRYRFESWITRKGRELAKKVPTLFDEHGDFRGSTDHCAILDYISPHHGSAQAPYYDMGGEGLALVQMSRTTVYARSCQWRPSTARTVYLIGKNEAGTYFAHAVRKDVETVQAAIQWIWGGHAQNIIQRQGDIALVRGNGPKNLNKLPSGHRIEGNQIVHATHPAIPVPGIGERIIVGRRASTQVAGNSRD